MIKVLFFVVLVTVGHGLSQHEGRQKRLLFYDEEGNLVKTYTNPYLRDLALHADKLPLYGNYLNPFFAFLRTSQSGSLPAFAIPVSSEIIQKIEYDPLYQQKLILSPIRNPVVASNPFCEGKRAQVPSPLNCNSFLNCWDGWSFEQDCPQGLMFSGNGYCDYADNVDCIDRSSSKPLISPKPQPSPTQPQPVPPQPQVPQSQAEPSLPSQPPCAQILPPLPPVPQNPIPQNPLQTQSQPARPPQIPQAPQPEIPQPQIPQPQLPQQQPSQPSQPQSPKPQPPQPQPPQAQLPQAQLPELQTFLEPQPQCHQDFETFRSQYNCNVFFVCVNRQPVKFHCPADLAYSQLLGVCDYQDRVDCGKAILVPIATISLKTTPAPTTSASVQDLPKQEDMPVVLIENTNYNSQSWSTTNIAMSRSDAIRQVLLKSERK